MSVDLPAPLPPTRPTTSPGVEVDRDAVDGMDATEGDPDVAHLDERDARPPWCGASAGSRGVVIGALHRSRRRARRMRVEADGGHEDQAHDDVLDRRVDAQQDHARLQRLHDDRAQDGARDRADAAGERGPADDGRGDDVQLGLRPEADRRGVQAGRAGPRR